MSVNTNNCRLEMILDEEPSSQFFEPPLPQPPPASPITEQRKSRGVCRRRYCFSEGFHNRLEHMLHAAEGKPTVSEGLEKNRRIVVVDFSSLSLEEASNFERSAFELYYTDKSVKKLSFEGNTAKFWGDFVQYG